MSSQSSENLFSPTPSQDALTLVQVEERAHHLIKESHSNQYELGQLYNYVVDKNLAQSGGFKDAQDFFKQRVKELSQPALSMYGTVANTFPQGVNQKYGMRKLYTLLTYTKRTNLTPELDKNEPGALLINVPREDGTLAPKPFAECTVDELRQAVKQLREPPDSVTDTDRVRVKGYQDTLERQLPAGHGVRVEARRRGDKLFVTLRNVPDTHVARMLSAFVSSPVVATATAAVPAQASGAALAQTPVQVAQQAMPVQAEVLAPQPTLTPPLPQVTATEQGAPGNAPLTPPVGMPAQRGQPPGRANKLIAFANDLLRPLQGRPPRT